MSLKKYTKEMDKPGNSATAKPVFFQPKLTVNPPNDRYEQQADNMADHVMQVPLSETMHEGFFKPAVTNRKSMDSNVIPGNTLGNIVQRVPIQPGSSSGQTVHGPTIAPSPTRLRSGANRTIPTGSISRSIFDDYVTSNFGVVNVRTGTQQEQEQSLTRTGSTTPGITNWQAWSPADPSQDYADIIKAIEDVGSTFGAIPNIRNIIFYEMHYEPGTPGIAVGRPDVGASFGAGDLTIYRAFASNRSFPIARSNTAGNYPPVVISISSPGSSPGAPSPLQNRQANISENIAHELGHGIAEAAHAADPQVFVNFNTTIGWVGSVPALLYDVGQPAVQTSIANATTPPSQYQITPGNWNDPRWIEQPMSNYSVTGGPGEDFAESIAAFVYARSVLQARSPHRYQFILNGINSWSAQMNPLVPPAPIGDFPENKQLQHTA